MQYMHDCEYLIIHMHEYNAAMHELHVHQLRIFGNVKIFFYKLIKIKEI